MRSDSPENGSSRTAALRWLALSIVWLSIAVGTLLTTAPPATLLPGVARAVEPDSCAGDEVITFAPASPASGEELLISATSSQAHRGVWITGTERPTSLRSYSGQLGTVWDYTVVLAQDGPHVYRFYVESTLLCAEATVIVGPPTRSTTPTPIRIFPPWGAATRADNSDNSDGDNDNSNDNGDSDNADNGAASLAQPTLSALSASSLCAGELLSIYGHGFGSERADVDGKVVIAGAAVRDYLGWVDDRVDILVPGGADTGTGTLYLTTAGGFDQTTVEVRGDCSGQPTAVPTGVPTVAPTAVPAPTITSVSRATVCPGGSVSLRGQRFGPSRDEVDGKVTIGGAEVDDYLSWSDTEITVLVPRGAATGPGRAVYLVTAGGFATTTLNVASAGCSGELDRTPRPRIQSVSPSQACPGAVITIRGTAFGRSRAEVGGKVVISGAEARDYFSWRPDQIVVLVPGGATPGLSRELYVMTAGGYDSTTLQVLPTPC